MSKFWVNEQMSKCVGWDFPPFPGFLTKIHTFLTEIKKENSSSIFDIAVNENLLYLKIDHLSSLLFQKLYCIQETSTLVPETD